jgi:hypothetical protein
MAERERTNLETEFLLRFARDPDKSIRELRAAGAPLYAIRDLLLELGRDEEAAACTSYLNEIAL